MGAGFPGCVPQKWMIRIEFWISENCFLWGTCYCGIRHRFESLLTSWKNLGMLFSFSFLFSFFVMTSGFFIYVWRIWQYGRPTFFLPLWDEKWLFGNRVAQFVIRSTEDSRKRRDQDNLLPVPCPHSIPILLWFEWTRISLSKAQGVGICDTTPKIK